MYQTFFPGAFTAEILSYSQSNCTMISARREVVQVQSVYNQCTIREYDATPEYNTPMLD